VLMFIVIVFIIIIKKMMMESIEINCLVYDVNIVDIMMRFIGLNITLFLNYYYYIVNILSIHIDNYSHISCIVINNHKK
jgi:hypothetical protein